MDGVSVVPPPTLVVDASCSYDELEDGITNDITCVIHPLIRNEGVIIIIAEGWPCWLPAVLALRLNLRTVFAPTKFTKCFGLSPPQDWICLQELVSSPVLPAMWNASCVLASGSVRFCDSLLSKLQEHVGPFIYTVDMKFARIRTRSLARTCDTIQASLLRHHLHTSLLMHADFGGVTSACHPVGYRNVHREVFTPFFSLPRTLSHIIDPAAKVHGTEIVVPAPLSLRGRTSLWDGDALRGEGLYEVGAVKPMVACRSVFKKSGWVKRRLTPKEVLRAFDVPAGLMDSLMQYEFLREVMQQGVPTGVLASVLRALGAERNLGGVEEGLTSGAVSPNGLTQSKDELSLGDMGKGYDIVGGGSGMVSMGDVDVMDCSSLNEIPKCRNRHNGSTESHAGLKPVALGADVDSFNHDRSLFVKLKEEHDIAKAVKDDDAEVPVELWNQAVCRGVASERECMALDTLRAFTLRVYRRRLGREVRDHLSSKFGRVCHERWVSELKKCNEVWKFLAVLSSKGEREDHSSLVREWKEKSRGAMMEIQKRWKTENVNSWLVKGWARKGQPVAVEVKACREIMWRASENEWFEYSAGSRLMYFRFPDRYRAQALEGVRVCFNEPGPTVWSSQPPPLDLEAKEVLRSKISKLLNKRYLVPTECACKSSIKYFAVPKGDTDWRVVFHAGANKLNDCVYTPSFFLPTVNSLLGLVDRQSLMSDRDIGEMFHNFQLHPNTVSFTAIDLAPLDLCKKEFPERWVRWDRTLMGFKSSPYNCVRMFLIAEEIIRGDRRDLQNAFQWESILLNLPGGQGYDPSQPWMSKRRRIILERVIGSLLSMTSG